ncbi:MAG: hypothetical protein MUP67_07805 [Acidimicrobiia bacterium]|nr:hypothetical protein [Acidimicrobiia bacterium]
MGRLGYSWGETEAERTARYPCDDLMPEPEQAAYRAVDVDAPAPLVFRWLGQLRVAPYSYDWIDNWGRRSPRELTPGLEDLALGQRAMVMFEVAGFEPDESLTLFAKQSVFGDVGITYRIVPEADETSRIVAKVVVTYPRVARLMRHVPPLGDLIMMRKQLRTLKQLAERDHARTGPSTGAAPS